MNIILFIIFTYIVILIDTQTHTTHIWNILLSIDYPGFIEVLFSKYLFYNFIFSDILSRLLFDPNLRNDVPTITSLCFSLLNTTK